MDDELVKTTIKLTERVERLLTRQKLSAPTQRILIALAGVPGSGKTTISDALIKKLKKNSIPDVAVLPMDGFHYTRTTLSSFEDPDHAFRRRGAPFTFDAAALLDFVVLLKKTPVTADDEPQIIIKAPGFDHARKDPIPDAIEISSHAKVVIIEGNYLLLDQEPWSRISTLVDDKSVSWSFVNFYSKLTCTRGGLSMYRST
ncbi:P-loop containing nucleoside triphosphate hydrolase protein [Fusarium redolens]|uniref:P-loop containing nucleoside triphosphate hydrolase protein n=1 Tax=Fusarium redolens TaxID=48865 RepID=A0A9P9FUQ1_FUSRE|nr:P-loop containing nucleoside triphosphate hydrolase protein [Fusarium redolens]KAH7207824.1 P-loop containing nucleoside triphosphate hydrolase protein [Fusarium redolens]